MGIDMTVNCSCDECGASLMDGDAIVCQGCYDEKVEEIGMYERDIEKLETQNKALKEKVKKLIAEKLNRKKG